MIIEKTPLYERQKSKLVKRNFLKRSVIDEAERLFESDHNNYKLRPHIIICKKDKNKVSLTIPNTSYRILYIKDNNIAYFEQILNHGKYDRVNKDC